MHWCSLATSYMYMQPSLHSALCTTRGLPNDLHASMHDHLTYRTTCAHLHDTSSHACLRARTGHALTASAPRHSVPTTYSTNTL